MKNTIKNRFIALAVCICTLLTVLSSCALLESEYRPALWCVSGENGEVYVYCYGDCIKIGVSLSTGEVLTFFASDYLKNHDGAEIKFAHTEEEAAALLADFDIVSLLA